MINRIITGIILICLGIYVILNGGLPLFLWVNLVLGVCLFELISMINPKKKWFLIILSWIIGAFVMWTTRYGDFTNLWKNPSVILIIFLIIIMAIVELFRKKIFFKENIPFSYIRSLLFMCGTLPFIYLLREGKEGFQVMLITNIVLWTSDISALFGGKAFGRRKLSSVSPNKTVEGSVIGVVMAILLSWIFVYFLKLDFLLYTLLAIFIAVLGQIGDLHESLTKRQFGVKDSSNILPGHGGFYDRADSYVLVMPVIYYLFNVI